MFSSNQVRHFYVVDANHPMTTQVGDSVERSGEKFISLQYNGEHVDLIEAHNIRKVTLTLGNNASQKVYARMAEVELRNVPAGMDMMFTIVVPSFYGDTLENKRVFNVLAKQASTNPTAATAVQAFVTKINNDNELKKYFYAQANSTNNNILQLTMPIDTTEYRRGIFQIKPLLFYVNNGMYIDTTVTNTLSPAYTPALFVTDPTYTTATAATFTGVTTELENGYNIADLEYFCHGFRGDIYRGKNWPDNIEYDYLVDPTQSYDVVDIHYFYQGEGNHSDKSEKVITIVGPRTSGSNNQAVSIIYNDIVKADSMLHTHDTSQAIPTTTGGTTNQ